MRNDKRLPDAELEVMQNPSGLWAHRSRRPSVQQHADKDWKMTSVLTFLSPLVRQGISFLHEGGTAKTCTRRSSARSDHRQRESVGFLRRPCGGSVKNLVASLSDAGRADRAGHRRAARVPRQADAPRRDLMLQFSEKLLNNLMQIGLTVSLAALVPAHSAAADEKRYPARMVLCGVGDSRAAAAHSGAVDTAAGAGAGHAAH